MTLECCFASITVTRTAVSTRVKPGKDWSSSLGGPLPNGSHERNIIQCRSASLGSGVSTLTRSECHRHNQTWHGFQPELGKNWQPVQNTRNLYRCQPNQSSRRFVVRPRWEKGLAKTSLPKLFGNKSSYQLPTPWTMAPTTNLLIGIQVETHTHFCVGNAMACPVCTQLRWRVSGPKKWCLLSFKVAGFSIKLLCSLRQFELDFNWKPWKPNKKKTKKTYYIPLSPGLFISRTPLFIPFKQIHGLRCQPKLSIQSSHAMYISMFKPFEETSATSIHRHLSWRTAKLRTTSLDCSCCKRAGKECGSARLQKNL